MRISPPSHPALRGRRLRDNSLLMLKSPSKAIEHLRSLITPARVLTSAIARYAFANDAGPYLLIPEAVLQPQTETEIQAIFRLAIETQTPVVFRAGGTNLSGQAITDGWLVDIGRYWRKVEVIDQGQRVRVQPGAIGGLVNANLKPFGTKIGPDPSSIMSAMMGGILSNNSSGMCCGVTLNSYHTLESIRFILPDGSIWDTSRNDEATRFAKELPSVALGLIEIRDSIRASSKLSQRIRDKYQQKNTVGYSLNAFIDYDQPLDILAHLLIGAEGTLAFISQATLKTVRDLPKKATAMAYFPDVLSACQSIPTLCDAGCAAIELMDFASLTSIRNLDGVPGELPLLLDSNPQLMAILFEFHAEDDASIDAMLSRFNTNFEASMSTLRPIEFTQNSKVQQYLWKLRKGMYPAVAAVRAKGEAAILEDIAVPVDKLGPAILDLQVLFAKHGYANGIIFGHAKDGNLHFVITQSMNGSIDVQKYARFIDDMVDLVVRKYDGALKAEHGTGRNMAPFVETEWGPEALELMKRLKCLLDPHGVLNPDVILSSQLAIHTKNLKDLPVVEDVVDKCIECGACEPRCPSRDFTLSPRQRIVVRRAAARLKRDGDTVIAKQLEREYQFSGLATCATDGLCAIDCPVDINTGDLVKHLRNAKTGRFDNWLAKQTSKHFGLAERAVKIALRCGMLMNSIFSNRAMPFITGMIAQFVPQFPQWHPSLSTESLPTNDCSLAEAEYIYLPACMSRMMGGTATQMLRVCERAGVRLHLPNSLTGLCCGQAFSSKGYPEVAADKQAEWINRAWELSDRGSLAIVTDLGSCSAFLQNPLPVLNTPSIQRLSQLRILDSIEFANDIVLPKLVVRNRLPKIAVHSVCANHKSDWDEKLIQLANVCADEVVVPHVGKCCGMGGDRGFANPALAKSATAEVKSMMDAAGCSHGYTSARSCAISLATSTGYRWKSIFHLLDEVSSS